MQIITGELAGHTNEYPLSRFGGRESVLAVDIETTGIVAEKSRIYLIGCGYWEEDCWKLIQWFDDKGDGEADILTSFLLFTKKFTTLVHYNGRQFDLPFLARRIVWNGLQGTPGAEDFPSAMKSMDLYRYVKPFQKLMSLPDCRQQTVEQFLGTNRTEHRSGKELIQVYLDYIGATFDDVWKNKKQDTIAEETKRIDAAMISRLLKAQQLDNQRKAAEEKEKEASASASGENEPVDVSNVSSACESAEDESREEASVYTECETAGNAAGESAATAKAGTAIGEGTEQEELTDRTSMRMALLAHNRADVAGLIALTDVLAWKDLLQAQLVVHRAQANTFRDANGDPQQELILHAKAEGVHEDTFPMPITASKDGCYCTIQGNRVTLKVPIYNGKLHYFYSNYKDYYFLPELDQAIHKSIATYVDPSHRQQATAQNCYTGKVGTFLPEWTKEYTPVFQESVKDKTAWFEFKPEMKKDKEFFAAYATYVYRHIIEI